MKSALSLFVLCFGVRCLAEQKAEVKVSLSPAGSFSATTTEVSGSAKKQGDSYVAQKISVVLKNLDSGIDLRDKHIQEHLKTNEFPEAILISAIGKDGQGEGLLKIRGIEKKIQGTYQIIGNELTAEFPLKLSDFGITGIRYMGIGAKDEVRLKVTVPLGS